MTQPFDTLLTDCNAAAMTAGGAPYGAIGGAAIGLRDGRIAWIGAEADLPDALVGPHTDVQRLGGRWVTPGLIDCHTHLVFAGDRTAEFEARANGATYQEIAKAGGGILSTVRATRAASLDDLVDQSADRLRSLVRDGVTTVEVKSGYGLDLQTELKQLRAAKALEARCGVTVVGAFLGLHALPPEYAGRADAWVDHVCADILPAVAAEGLATAVDAYVEPIAFTAEQARRFFAAAAARGLRPKLHAGQFTDHGATALAAQTRALSADHLEYVDEAGVAALAAADVVAVLLPGAFVALREERTPPVDAMRRHGLRMAVATDCNPGTSPLTSLLTAMALACAAFRLTPEEALAGATRHAAAALGLDDRGTLEVGKRADLAVWDVAGPAELSYWLGRSRLWRRYVEGRAA